MLRVGVRFVFEKKTHHTREFYRTTKRSSLAAGKSNLTDYTNTHHSVRVGLRDVLDRRTEEQVYFLSHADYTDYTDSYIAIACMCLRTRTLGKPTARA